MDQFYKYKHFGEYERAALKHLCAIRNLFICNERTGHTFNRPQLTCTYAYRYKHTYIHTYEYMNLRLFLFK